MFYGFNSHPFRGRLLRGAAFFFLLFTVADVSFPLACFETSDVSSPAQQAFAPQLGAGTAHCTETVDARGSRSDQSPENGCCDEYCCFACANVLSAIAVTEVTVHDLRSPSVTTPDRFMPDAPLRTTYHPPRLA